MVQDITDIVRYAFDVSIAVVPLLGLHKFDAYLVKVTTSGAVRPGVGGTRVRTDTRIYIGSPADGYLNPKIKQVSDKDIVLSGNRFKDLDLVMGPLVRPYTSNGGGGWDPNLFAPIDGAKNTQIYIKLVGPGLDVNGAYFEILSSKQDSSLSYRYFLRNTGQIIP